MSLHKENKVNDGVKVLGKHVETQIKMCGKFSMTQLALHECGVVEDSFILHQT